MKPNSESARHKAIHVVKSGLTEEARLLLNGKLGVVSNRLKGLINCHAVDAAQVKWEVMRSGVIRRLISGELEKSEQRRIGELAKKN